MTTQTMSEPPCVVSGMFVPGVTGVPLRSNTPCPICRIWPRFAYRDMYTRAVVTLDVCSECDETARRFVRALAADDFILCCEPGCGTPAFVKRDLSGYHAQCLEHAALDASCRPPVVPCAVPGCPAHVPEPTLPVCWTCAGSPRPLSVLRGWSTSGASVRLRVGEKVARRRGGVLCVGHQGALAESVAAFGTYSPVAQECVLACVDEYGDEKLKDAFAAAAASARTPAQAAAAVLLCNCMHAVDLDGPWNLCASITRCREEEPPELGASPVFVLERLRLAFDAAERPGACSLSPRKSLRNGVPRLLWHFLRQVERGRPGEGPRSADFACAMLDMLSAAVVPRFAALFRDEPRSAMASVMTPDLSNSAAECSRWAARMPFVEAAVAFARRDGDGDDDAARGRCADDSVEALRRLLCDRRFVQRQPPQQLRLMSSVAGSVARFLCGDAAFEQALALGDCVCTRCQFDNA